MTWLVAPENDYRALLDMDAAEPSLRVAVIVPAYNRIGLLARTLAGVVAATSYPKDLIEVIVIDDGSDREDPAEAIPEQRGGPAIRLLRQERSGYGAGRARNLGANETTAEVLLFLDADCLPVPDLVARHVAWHHLADNLAVVGSRHHLDTTDLEIDSLRSGGTDVRSLLGDDPMTDDWRRPLQRRTAGWRHGTEAYRAVLSGNLSIRRDRFLAAGGFSGDFTTWGGEDTELGWRLFNAGMYIVPDDWAAIFHQSQEESHAEASWRSRERSDEIIRSKIPHRFYRGDLTDGGHQVPKMTWVIAPKAGGRAPQLMDQLSAQRVTDWEVVFPLDHGIDSGEGRVHVLPDQAGTAEQRVLRAIGAARGEYIAVLSGAAAPDPLLADRLVRSLDRTPRASVALARYHAVTEQDSLDAAWGFGDLPAFALSRRREWAKVARRTTTASAAWQEVLGLSTVLDGGERLVTLPLPEATPPTSLLPAVASRTAAAELARKGGPIRRGLYRLAQRLLRRKRHGRPDARPAITHIGDSASLAALRANATWGVVGPSPGGIGLVIGGGATLDRVTFERIRLADNPRVERIVVGATAGDSPVAEWADFLQSCAAVGLAGRDDVAAVRSWGYDGPVAVVGHPGEPVADLTPLLEALREGMA